MTKRLLTKKEQEQLKRNPNVTAVSEKAITYTDEFKRHFIAENEQGKLPREIFKKAGFDVELIGLERIRSSGKRWRASYREAGIEGLQSVQKRVAKAEADEIVKEIIIKACRFRGRKKGARQIKMTLQNQYDITYNLKRIRRIMKKFEIICPIRKANPARRMEKATKEHRTCQNELQRHFKQGVAGKVLLTDITYLTYKGGKRAYLSTVKDAETNEILAYEASSSLSMEIALNTLHKLKKHRHLAADAFIHSDQGFHYTNPHAKH